MHLLSLFLDVTKIAYFWTKMLTVKIRIILVKSGKV